ncbi:hypothetical protein HDU85_004162 [Gaertneriomyces sp. JEL0708]|nr:hypothetical protein HDU85_004162 [Gaertneriomyces sp. JEL0708]
MSANSRIDEGVLEKIKSAGHLDSDTEKQLFAWATAAKDRSYSPYSKFRVGAALISSTGNVWLGGNIESASYGATRCAEQTAVQKAVSEGEKQFIAVGVATDTDGYISPCGICRQFMVEFGKKLWVYNFKLDGSFRKYRLEELLPDSFGPDDLDRPRE